MAASKSGAVHTLPHAVNAPSNALEPRSSLNSAVRSASSVAENLQAQHEEEEGAAEGREHEEQLTHFNENGRKRAVDSANMMNGSSLQGLSAQLSRLGSLGMEDLSEEDEMASTSGSDSFEASELELIEAALRSLRIVGGGIEGSTAVEHNLSGSGDLQDMHDIARLLKKVQAVKAQKKGSLLENVQASGGGSCRQGLYGGDDMGPADIQQVVQAAAQTALAAAKTAETVVTSLNRNSKAMEALCQALTTGTSLEHSTEDSGHRALQDHEDERKLLAIELQQTEIAKSLVRQNRMTHWVLGFIVVSSLIWRYGVVKFVKKVNHTISNPFQGITDMFKGQKEQVDKGHNIPQLKLPGILDNEEESRRLSAQEKEDNMFNLSGFLPGLNGEDKAEQQKLEQRKRKAKQEEGNNFSFGDIFPGLPGDEKAEQPKHKGKDQGKVKGR